LRETPRRAAAAFSELLTHEPVALTTFANDAGYDELVVVAMAGMRSLRLLKDSCRAAMRESARCVRGAGLRRGCGRAVGYAQASGLPRSPLVPIASTVSAAAAARQAAVRRHVGAYTWLFKVAWEIPYDKADKLRPRLHLH
jgi:hypothetical protein